MIKRMIVMLVLVAIVAAAFVAWKMHAMHAGMAQMAAGFAPPTVSTVTAGKQDWQPQLNSVASLRAVNGADLSSEVSGIVETLSFDSGADVEKGAVLVQLRAEDDVARLHALNAQQKLAQITLDRDMKQLKEQAVSQAAIDNDLATLNNAKAQTDAQQAVVDKKTIHAPFSGHLGIRQVDVGQYLNPGMAIVTLQQLDPTYADFNLPEQALPRLSVGLKVSLTTDTYPGVTFKGKITAINSKVDDATRNIGVRAAFDNPDHKLLPGMFGHVSVDSGAPVKYITLPQTAIVFNTYGNTVYLLEHGDDGKNTVKQSVVKAGETRGDQVAILSGVKEGDEVVTSGQVKLRNGIAVTVSDDDQPESDADPKPHQQ
jgi:membrane fusion protein (multidrug efflux system)